MICRQATCAILALVMANGVTAQPLPAPDKNGSAHQSGSDLTGYWQQDDGQIFYFVQEGTSLISRHAQRSAGNNENEVDFTATIYGNLVYGAHRSPGSRAMQEKCAQQIWVGMGLTLNDDRTELTGFRGVRIVDAKGCSVKDSDPVGLVYSRIDDPEL